MAYLAIEKALQSGARIHAFASGGGLRVVRVESRGRGRKEQDLDGYGEHPYLEEALLLADRDTAKPKPYKAKFLTGSTASSSALDRWLLDGNQFDVAYSSGRFRFILRDWERKVCATRSAPSFAEALTHAQVAAAEIDHQPAGLAILSGS